MLPRIFCCFPLSWMSSKIKISDHKLKLLLALKVTTALFKFMLIFRCIPWYVTWMFRAFVRNCLMPDTRFYRRFLDAQSRPFLNDCFLFLWFFSGKIRHKTEITEHAQICKYVNLLGLPENRLLEAIRKIAKKNVLEIFFFCQFHKQQWTAAFRLISIFWSISSNIPCIWLNFLSC